ncbi:hypothetical protein GCM10010245_85370 [Streptomyces spectabilis]|nr:hypothetical protein GCM10010245_85370 [Streptomyces spectabilis]
MPVREGRRCGRTAATAAAAMRKHSWAITAPGPPRPPPGRAAGAGGRKRSGCGAGPVRGGARGEGREVLGAG